MFNPQLWHAPVVSDVTFRQLSKLKQQLESDLRDIADNYADVRFASSLAVEDMVITEVIDRLKLPIKVFTLNTGELHQETLELFQQAQERFKNLQLEENIHDAESVRDIDENHGISSNIDSLEHRKLCCSIRKIEPLNRALEGADAWLTGQRQSQSSTRTKLTLKAQDAPRASANFNPIFAWEEDDVWAYVKNYDLHVNRLYENGYPSVGCEPCTRPIKLSEDIRAGRWWWENKDSKECGLHQTSSTIKEKESLGL